MRPDRFMQSANREFVQSRNRERDHPYGDRPTYTGVTLFMIWGGFPPFPRPPIGTFPSFPTPGRSPGTLIYKRARVTEAATRQGPFGWSATQTWEIEHPFLITNETPVIYRLLSQDNDGQSVAAIASGLQNVNSVTLTSGDETSEQWESLPGFDSYSGKVELFGPTNVFADYYPIGRGLLTGLSSFPLNLGQAGRYRVNDQHEAVLTNGVGGLSSTVGLIRRLSAGRGAFPQLGNIWGYMGVPEEGYEFTLSKRLVPLVDHREWVVRGQRPTGAGGGNLVQPVLERSCGSAAGIEVLLPPDIDPNSVENNTQDFVYRSYQFPADPRPPAGEIGNLIPSCAPTFT